MYQFLFVIQVSFNEGNYITNEVIFVDRNKKSEAYEKWLSRWDMPKEANRATILNIIPLD